MTAPPSRPPGNVGPTRLRDLATVALVAAVLAYGIARFQYSSLPTLPRLAGSTAALLGLAEALWGRGLRRRIQARRRPRAGAADRPADGPLPPPVPALLAARALAVAKASALAGAALSGLWIGFGAYLLPSASRAPAIAADLVTAVVSLAAALVLVAGALWLEYCCRAPDPS